MNILYVEDDQQARKSLRVNLELLGHQVMTAGSIAEANEVLAVNSFDRIIVDGTLRPGKDRNGIEFAERLIRQGKKAVVFSADTRYMPDGVPAVSKNEPGPLSLRIDKLLAL